jgi:2-polyprenyl-6-methoxyphenol hydroxylase-like FAD-dependent oxidoreductase
MRVLISGGGIAGLTLAYWLDHYGFTPVVIERAPRGRGDGYGIDFHGSGYDIASRMGITDALQQRQLPIESVDFIDAKGRATARLDRRLLEKIIDGPHLALMHSTLEHELTQAIQAKVEIRYEQTITAVRQATDRVHVSCSSGDSEDFDLLVGADGVHSETRRLVFGDESRYTRHLGYQLACHPVIDEFGLANARLHYTEPGRQVVVYPSDRDGQSIALYLFRSNATRSAPRAQRTDLLRRTFAGMDWITPRLLAQAPDDIFMDTLTQTQLPHWHHARVALIGDASGCMTLVSAQGVSMAMAGAYILAKELHAAADHRSAFERYQRRLRPQVERRQRNARVFAASLVPSTKLGMRVQNIAAGAIMRDAFAPLLRRRFGVASILSTSESDHQKS